MQPSSSFLRILRYRYENEQPFFTSISCPYSFLDLRDDSTTPLNFTKSINLALSERGINAMRNAKCEGLLDDVFRDAIPMHSRMIHGRKQTGELFEESQKYDAQGRCINAVDRAGLNKRLLDALDKFPNVTLHFNHKLTGANFNTNTAWFEHLTQSKLHDHAQNPSQQPPTPSRPRELSVSFDFFIGADGAHSATRFHLMKYARLFYQQEYISTLWCEFHIPPSPTTSSFAISPNHLHIWPAGSFMFIAIPSTDKSFTCTLFASPTHFSTIASDPPTQLPAFFKTHFPGVTPALISEADLLAQFQQNPHLPLISIKCTPYHYGASVVILGDAAHAMVPFYGQGMNAGLEDVLTLFTTLDDAGVYDPASPLPLPTTLSRTERREKALETYTMQRTPDAHTINDLAMGNYREMAGDVTSVVYKLRKWLEERLSVWVPGLGWRTQYSRVSFENQRYGDVVREVRGQGRVLGWVLGGGVFGVLGVMGLVLGRGFRGERLRGVLG